MRRNLISCGEGKKLHEYVKKLTVTLDTKISRSTFVTVGTSRDKIESFSERCSDNVKFTVITFILQVKEKKIEK